MLSRDLTCLSVDDDTENDDDHNLENDSVPVQLKTS